MLGSLARQLDRAFFRPDSLSPDAVTTIALAPPVIAGLILFRLAAAELLAVAVFIGLAVQLIARLLRWRLDTSPVLVVIVGVALCGPFSPPVLPALVALAAAVLEVLRSRYWLRARIHSGVVAYAAVFLGSGGAVAAYVRPGDTRLFPEPIAQWSEFYGGAAHFVEPITLYVGNVAGPVFATSLLGVAIGLAWLWYARRLSIVALLGFLLAGIAISVALRWDPVFQLDSGPTWFVVGFALCDRRLLPEQHFARPVMATAAAVLGLGLRAAHLYVEALFLAVATLEIVFALAELVARAVASGFSRLRRPAETESASA